MVESDVYSWIEIPDSAAAIALSAAQDAQATADGKRRVFITTPTVPYDIGDL
jgi:phage-related protein